MDVPLPNSDGKLAALVDEVVERGQEVTLTRDGVPAAEIVADAPPPSGRARPRAAPRRVCSKRAKGCRRVA